MCTGIYWIDKFLNNLIKDRLYKVMSAEDKQAIKLEYNAIHKLEKQIKERKHRIKLIQDKYINK